MASYALNGSLVMIPLLQDTHRLLVTNYSVFMKSNYIVASVFFLIFAHGQILITLQLFIFMLLKFWYSHQSVMYVILQVCHGIKILRITVLNYTTSHPPDCNLIVTTVRTSCLNYWSFIGFSLQDHIHKQVTAAKPCYISGSKKKGISFLFLNIYVVTL